MSLKVEGAHINFSCVFLLNLSLFLQGVGHTSVESSDAPDGVSAALSMRAE